MAASSLEALRKVCVPREDVLEGGLADNHFAAQLDKVVRDAEHYPVYGDAQAFFAHTYPTSGLKTLLTKTFGRLSGAKGVAGENGVLRPTTSFGGGKTHGLTAVYHLARGARPSNIAEFLDPILLPDGPVQIAALVGDALDPTAGIETNGHRTYTMWGEMAAQIGDDAFAAMEANDTQRTAPGTATIKAAFCGKPTVVIVDEIAKHLRAVTSSGSEDVRRMAGAIPVFLGNLFEVASDPTNKVSVIITLAATTNAFGAETTEISELTGEEKEKADAANAASVKAAQETGDVLARAVRPSAVITPADDNEIGEILKKRIFASVDEDAARAAGDAYRGLYEQLAKTEQLAGGAEHPASYGHLVTKTYPFHPELVRVLDKRLGNITEFQRARGALKLLAEVVANIYAANDDTVIINIGDIDYANEPVLNHLTDGLGRAEYASVARGDFASNASHAAVVDADVFPGKPAYATRVARTVFTHSLEMVSTAGAGRNDWLVGTLCPGEDATIFEKALTESEKVFWHLSYDGARWRFNIEPNVNAIIETEKRNVANTAVAAEVDSLVHKAFANDGGVTAIHFPSGPVEIPDKDALRVVVLDHDVVTVDPRHADQPPAQIVEMLDKAGSVGTPRKYRNSLVFALADAVQVPALKDRARALIASNNLAADTHRLGQFSEEVRKKVEAYDKEARLQARIAVTRCFKHIYYPADEKATGYLRHGELAARAQGDPKNATSAVVTLLTDEDKIRTSPFTASFLRNRTWANKEATSTAAIADYFWSDHKVSIVRNTSLLRDAIVNGVNHDNWVYYDSARGKAYTANNQAGMSITFSVDTEVMTMTEAQKRGLLVRKPNQTDLRSVLTSDQLTGADLRARLEAACGGEPSKTDVLDLLATAVQSSEYGWFVVTDTEPAAGVRALSPSAIKDKGLDTLHVLPRDTADEIRVEVPTRTVTSKTFSASGPGGAAMQSLLDAVSDYTIRNISTLTLKVSADAASGTSDLDLAVASLGMLQRQTITVRSTIRAEYKGLTGGGIQFQGAAERAEFQVAYGHAKKALTAATKVVGDVTLTFRFHPALDVDDPQFAQIHDVIKKLGIKSTTMTAEVTK
ncbi:ATP-binding protein [Streptomyces sp. NPDC048650]|uniref:ATP-binding protein n=1 Tax=Streptomyces sp. NPDC048650 TaxID=3365583 RepID=UPI0037149CC2